MGSALFLFALFREVQIKEGAKTMPKYFMGDTRLSSLERMMMDPSRSAASPAESRRNQPQKKTQTAQPAKPCASDPKPKEDVV